MCNATILELETVHYVRLIMIKTIMGQINVIVLMQNITVLHNSMNQERQSGNGHELNWILL